MTDATLVPELLRRESRSYLQYVHESFPWAQGHDGQLRQIILGLAEAESTEISRLGRYLQRLHIPLAFLGAYPSSYMTSNFVSIGYLLPRLIADHKQKIAELERDLPSIQDPGLREQLSAYRDVKRIHLQQLETLTAGKAA